MTVDGHDVVSDYRAARAMIGLVPQELAMDIFETVWATVSFSRGLWGKPAAPEYLAKVLKELSLWDRKDDKTMTLSGGMKRRVMIAKGLSHEPQILFLDEPTAGVDVELRKDMWQLVRTLRASGVTIILTTHYIEEAEQMADRIGIISKGKLILVEDKVELMRKLGRKQLTLQLYDKLADLPPALAGLPTCSCQWRQRARLHLQYSGRADRHHGAAWRSQQGRHPLPRPADDTELARGHLRRLGEARIMNWRAVRAIYRSRWRAAGAPCCRASSRR